MTKEEYLKIQEAMWKVLEDKLPSIEFPINKDDPKDFEEYLEYRYIKYLAGLE